VVQISGREQVQEFKLKERWQDIVTQFEKNPERLRQYVSNEDTPFFTKLAREPDSELPGAGVSHLLFADAIMVMDPWPAPQVIDGGEEVELTLQLRPLKTTTGNVSLATRLVGRDEALIWSDQQWPGGWPSSQWEPFGTYYDSRSFVLPHGTAPGVYRLEIYFSAAESGDPLPAHEIPSGRARGSVVALGYLVVADGSPPPPLEQPIHFGAEIALVAADLPPSVQAAPGESLSMRLDWQALQSPQQEYTGFVHLLNAEGNLVAQQDHPAAHGVVSTRAWQTGVTMPDDYSLQLPADLAPGSYSVAVGLYNVENGQRLAAVSGEESLGDAAILGRLIVGAGQ